MVFTRSIVRALSAAALLLPLAAHAWWSDDWAHRKKISISPAATSAAVEQFAVPIRLHTGNFAFLDAKENGADLRFVASDDKTPLKFHVERFDATNELAIVWVRVPKIAAGEAIWMYYGNPKAPAGDDAKGTFDSAQTAVLHFAETNGVPKDASAYANDPVQSSAKPTTAGWLGGGAGFDGQGRITWSASPSLAIKGSAGWSFSAWVKPAGPQVNATLFSQGDGATAVTVTAKADRVVASVAGVAAEMPLSAGNWHHVAVTASSQLIVAVDGKASSPVPVTLPDIATAPSVGVGFNGDLDEIALANVARSNDWIATQYQTQSADSKVVAVGEPEDASDGGGASYFRILLGAVTPDGWAVIGVLMVMMVIAFWVMVSKTISITRMERANAKFRAHFAKLSGELTSIDRGDPDDDADDAPAAPPARFASAGAMATRDAVSDEEYEHSSLYRVYHVGVRELKHRFDLYERAGQPKSLSPQAIAAIKASIDAGLTRETLRLNSRMVLLTIAISGGPFLGLLGTVVGVMITFAAIAAVGDVNVNSIAPGIAAALVATVAGLGVAIPSLFGYNWLASRVKEISTDMQIFADEFITKLAESYAP